MSYSVISSGNFAQCIKVENPNSFYCNGVFLQANENSGLYTKINITDWELEQINVEAEKDARHASMIYDSQVLTNPYIAFKTYSCALRFRICDPRNTDGEPQFTKVCKPVCERNFYYIKTTLISTACNNNGLFIAPNKEGNPPCTNNAVQIHPSILPIIFSAVLYTNSDLKGKTAAAAILAPSIFYIISNIEHLQTNKDYDLHPAVVTAMATSCLFIANSTFKGKLAGLALLITSVFIALYQMPQKTNSTMISNEN